MKKKLICLAMSIMLLILCFGTALAEGTSAQSKFDLNIFRNQNSLKYNKKQYIVTIDDMESRGFISLNGYILPSDDGHTYNYINADMWLYVCYPDVYLANYGTSKFYPIPRIWFEYYGKDLYTYQTAIFKIGETTYTFNNIHVSQNTSNWSKNCRFESKMVCVCKAEYKDFMNSWIANGTKQIKVRLKGTKNTQDFMLPSEAQADILLMFQNFKDAGGYNLLPR